MVASQAATNQEGDVAKMLNSRIPNGSEQTDG